MTDLFKTLLFQLKKQKYSKGSGLAQKTNITPDKKNYNTFYLDVEKAFLEDLC